MPCITTYKSAFDQLYESYEKQEREELKHRLPKEDPLWYIDDPLSIGKKSRGSGRSGRDRLSELQEKLDGFGLDRSEDQRLFHNEMLKSLIPLIFKDDFDENYHMLQKEFNTRDFQTECMFITPRRWGKTYSVAMMAAASAVSIEGTSEPFEQAIFSTGRRASKKLLDLIYRFLCKLPGIKESIIVHNVETIWIQGPYGPTDIRKIYSYPSKVRLCMLVNWNWRR